MDGLLTFGSVGMAIVIALLVTGLLEAIERVVTRERAAARAALKREYELHEIDAEALAKGLSAMDEAA